ncbi:hypothetical protein JO972_15480 [Verrucomicrobiaceae bacterium 5K15]|uniref:DUF1449 domain-containing protein n=1 Tax=Oceaniferula flava TaxID=2800421 RepID=A0AAE2SFF1_9BACT|nr:hypothetical protein [Oceaniferula flavus]MBK1856372.1 hypothetical protein [Oceaniferula flavus]MBM1137679.1 hypothetical protein [Oceaniferula flavus]
MLYWISCILGIFGVDSLEIDLDADVDLDADLDGDGSNVPSPIAAALRFVNAADVPLMAVLSLLAVFMWVVSMMANYYLNPEHQDWLLLVIFFSSFLVSVILVKMATAPLVPIFRKMKELEKAEPAVGGTAIVTSVEVTGKYGQAEQKRSSGAPATLTCITNEESPIPRGTEVAVISYDKSRGIYTVRTL